jgi:hypothetical protein
MTYYSNQRYSRLKRIEEGRNRRTIFLYIFLSILFVIFLIFLGPKFLGFFSGLVANINSDNQESVVGDTNPPIPPRFNFLPKFTNTTTIDVSGSSEPDSTVVIFIDDSKHETVADNQGMFSTKIDLNKSENNIFGKAVDLAGNESGKSQSYIVTYDDEKPEVEISKPKEGESFYGNSQRQLTLEGKTEANTKVTINDRVVIVDGSGNFRFPTSLGDGENSFNVKVTDQAGNLTELTVKVTFTP